MKRFLVGALVGVVVGFVVGGVVASADCSRRSAALRAICEASR
jgi:gas vesicle protein